MTKYGKMQKAIMIVLIAMLVASFALTVIAFAAPPTPARIAPPHQPRGWMCYGYACWEWPPCWFHEQGTHWFCTNWCQSWPGGEWRCLGQSGCQNGC
jgi:hypothetical protein